VANGKVKYGKPESSEDSEGFDEKAYKTFTGSKAEFRALIARELDTQWHVSRTKGYSAARQKLLYAAQLNEYDYDEAALVAHGKEDVDGNPTGFAIFQTEEVLFTTINAHVDELRRSYPKGEIKNFQCYNNPEKEKVWVGLSKFHADMPRKEYLVDIYGVRRNMDDVAKYCSIRVHMPYLKGMQIEVAPV